MRLNLCSRLTSAFCLLALLFPSFANAADAAREVPARLLPVPTTVSEQLAKFIAAPPNPTADDEPKTAEQWQALIDAYDAEGDKGARALWAALKLTVTPV